MTTIAFENAMIAIVQQDDIASTDAAQALNHCFGGLGIPIARQSRPHDDACSAAFSDEATEQWAAKTKGRTHPAGPPAGGGVNRVVTSVKFDGNAGSRAKCQRRMGMSVIADGMALRGNISGDRSSCPDPLSDEKECGFDIVAIE